MITIEKNRSTFNETISRIYEENKYFKKLEVNSRYCKTFTFQVTEDCNLKCNYCYQINKTHKNLFILSSTIIYSTSHTACLLLPDSQIFHQLHTYPNQSGLPIAKQ